MNPLLLLVIILVFFHNLVILMIFDYLLILRKNPFKDVIISVPLKVVPNPEIVNRKSATNLG